MVKKAGLLPSHHALNVACNLSKKQCLELLEAKHYACYCIKHNQIEAEPLACTLFHYTVVAHLAGAGPVQRQSENFENIVDAM